MHRHTTDASYYLVYKKILNPRLYFIKSNSINVFLFRALVADTVGNWTSRNCCRGNVNHDRLSQVIPVACRLSTRAVYSSIYSGKAKKKSTNPLPFKPQLQRKRIFLPRSSNWAQIPLNCRPCAMSSSWFANFPLGNVQNSIAWMIRNERGAVNKGIEFTRSSLYCA